MIFAVPTAKIFRITAFHRVVWWEQIGRIKPLSVWDRMVSGDCSPTPYHNEGSPSHAYHERRIAYLALNFPEDPIEIGSDYGFPEIVDGNHRACAALIRREQTILVDFLDKQSEL